jgi:hypothetical protein
MKWQVILIAVLAIFGAYLVISTAVGPFEPVGRLAFVKTCHPDMYPDIPILTFSSICGGKRF